MDKKINSKKYYIYGKHASTAALENPKRKIYQIFVNNKNFNLIPKQHKKITKIIDNQDFNNFLPKNSVHQGIAIHTTELDKYNIHEIDFSEVSKIVMLDQITDPQNYGAILRSAACFEIDLVIISKDNFAVESSVVAKTSSTALEKIKIVEVVNLNETIKFLKKQNFWIVGLDGSSDEYITPKTFEGNICIVMGSEGKGLRRLTKSSCDSLVKIPMSDKMESLNVSSASSIAFYQSYIAKKLKNDRTI